MRRYAPRIAAAGDDAELARDEAARSARMPGVALRAARDALASGPVLFQVPRRGYVVAVACEACGARARCSRCGGPLSLPAAGAAAACGWCGRTVDARCPGCGQARLRALVVGARRTAEELGRAFPAAPVRTSGGTEVIAEVDGAPAVVVATPGAEPRAAGGYAAAILLDGWALLGRASLRAAEEALRRWLNAAALVRPGPDGGRVRRGGRWRAGAGAGAGALGSGDARRARARGTGGAAVPARGPGRLAGRSAGRRARGSGRGRSPGRGRGARPGARRRRRQPARPGEPGSDGREPPESVRVLVRVDRPEGTALAVALHAAQAFRSARKDAGPVRLQLDPGELL